MIFGVPLTRPEEAELMKRREVAHSDADKLTGRLGGEQSDRFGGVYMDNSNGLLVVAVTEDASSARAELAPHASHPDRLRVVSVSYAWRSLSGAQQLIRAHQEKYYVEDGVYVTSTAPDVRTNRLLVTVAGDPDAARTRLARDVDPELLDITVANAAKDHGQSGSYPAPYKSGRQISNTQTRGSCSIGFSAYRNTVPATMFLLTAGHCGTQNDLFTQGGPDATPIGRISLGAYVAQGDAARITIPAGTQSADIVLTPSGISRFVQNEQGRAGDISGDIVCATGYNIGGGTCGEIKNTSYDLYRCTDTDPPDPDGVRCAQFTVLRQATFISIKGMSGGPVFYDCSFCNGGVTAAGLIKGTDAQGDDAVYTHIYDARVLTDTHGLIKR